MEYCITVLVEGFQPDPTFLLPKTINTVWGQAQRADEVGKYFWTDDLYVQPQPRIPYLLRFLPANLQNVDWTFLNVGGAGLHSFECKVNEVDDDEELSRHPLLLLIRKLLEIQSHWIVFFEKDCDQIAVVYRQTLQEFCRTIIDD